MREWWGGRLATRKSVTHVQRAMAFMRTSAQGRLLSSSAFTVEQVVQLFDHKPKQGGTQEQHSSFGVMLGGRTIASLLGIGEIPRTFYFLCPARQS